MNRINQLAFASIVALCAPTVWAQLPDGPGKDAVMQVCAKCHDVGVITGYHQDTQGWTDTISKMMDQGADGTEAQFNAILAYLVKNFGPDKPAVTTINVNKAEAKDLEAQLDITAKEADAIVKYRGDKGPFKAVADLKNVPDLDYKKIDAKKDRIVF